MDRGHRGLHGFVAVVAFVVGACGVSNPASTPTPTPIAATAAAGPTSPPALPTLAAVTETPVPAPTSTPTPPPTPTPPKGWTAPHPVGTGTQCRAVTAGIDAASRYHIAAECDGSIHYYFASRAGGSWTARVFAHPAHRAELDPQIAFRGNVVYVAYSRIAPDAGCGGLGSDVGVYFRSRSQPNGAWSAATRIGSVADSLQSFRVDGGTIHATVQNDGRVYYETLDGSTYHRYRISGAGRTSMRVGSDGRARIAYEAGQGGLRYAVFTGSRFSTSRIAGSTEADSDPLLVLDASDKAHVVWTRREAAACGDIPVGMYYATNASGTWKSRRITKDVGDASLQVDGATGRVHVLVGDESGLTYYTTVSNGPWTRTTVASTQWARSPVIRLDPATGTLLVVYIDEAPTGSTRIYALTKL